MPELLLILVVVLLVAVLAILVALWLRPASASLSAVENRLASIESSQSRFDGVLQAFACATVRSMIETLLRGDLPVGLVGSTSGCDAVTTVPGILNAAMPSLPVVSLRLPIAVESEAPHGVRVYRMSAEDRVAGTLRCEEAAATWVHLQEVGAWCYPTEITEISRPTWALRQELIDE